MNGSMRVWLGALTIGATGMACNVRSEPSAASAAAHTEGEVVASLSPFHWASLREDELVGSPERTAPANDPMVVRLQAWADRVHDIVVEEAHVRGVSFIPARPVLHVARSAAFNAWNRGTLVATGARFEGTSGFTFLAKGSLIPVSASELGGLTTRPAEWPSTHGLVEVWRASQPACDLVERADHRLASTSCAPSAQGNIVVAATTPHVYLTSRLLAEVDEKTAVLVLAHELGHYYRAHVSSLAWSRYDFWYAGTDGAHRPLPSERGRAFGEQYRSVLEAPRPVPAVAARHHARMVPLIARLALQISAEPAAAKACSARVQAAGASRWLPTFLLADAHAHGEADVEELQRYEADLVACASGLKVGFPDAETINRSGVESFLVDGGFASSTEELRGLATLADVLAYADQRSREMDRAEEEMLAELRGGNFGFYTSEQEADEIALEVLAKLGVSAREAEEGWLAFMDAAHPSSDPGASTGTLGARECRALYEAGFTETVDGKRQLAAMTLGDLRDPHHGGCYRLFNLWMESQTHRYVAQGTFSPPAGEGWATLRTHAGTLTPTSRP